MSVCAANIRPDGPGARVATPPGRVSCSVSATAAPPLPHHLGEGAPERPSKEDVEEEIDEVVREHEQLEDGETHVRVGRHVRLLVGGHLEHVEQVDAVAMYDLVEDARAGAQREVERHYEQHHGDLVRRKLSDERYPAERRRRRRCRCLC